MTQDFFWLRKELNGAWAMPFACSSTLPQELPRQLREHLQKGNFTEIHLPCLDKHQELMPEQRLRIISDIPGRAIIVPDDAEPHYLTRYQILLATSAARNGISEPRFRLAASDGTVLAGRESIAWQKPPLERQTNFFQVYSTLARSFQAHLRNAFSKAYFANIESFSDTNAAWPVLLYAASKPYLSKARHAFTYEVLDNNAVEKFYRSTTRGLPPVLAAVEARLAAAGKPDLARLYGPNRVEKIVQEVMLYRNPMRSLLMAESMLFDVLFRFGRKMHDLAECPRGLRTAPTACEAFVRNLRSRLRRFYNGVPMFDLALPIFLNATHALFEARQAESIFVEEDWGSVE